MDIKNLWIMLLLLPLLSSAQLRPFLVDPGSNIGSVAIKSKYNSLRSKEIAIRRELNKFIADYTQRLFYLESSGSLVRKIKKEIEITFNRYSTVQISNYSLSSLFSSSKKKENKKKLSMILIMLNNSSRELRSQKSRHILYGEKLNLYQNSMESLSKINRLLDEIEDNIETSKFSKNIFN